MKYKHNLYGKSTLSPQQILTKFLYEAGKWKLLNCTNIYHELVFLKKKLVIRSGRFKVANRLSLSLSLCGVGYQYFDLGLPNCDAINKRVIIKNA